ncbi:MAG: T9SS type A sorting domain-containing protein, partial [Planctomycetes bacterium]|nr:T9SS type A sorting domain-containing protein [Planctomycetota bacterium]
LPYVEDISIEEDVTLTIDIGMVHYFAPPANLTTQVSPQGVVLQWDEPAGGGGLVELAIDSGTIAGYSSGWQVSDIVASRLEIAEGYPLVMHNLRALMYNFDGADDSGDLIFHIFDVNADGSPGEAIYSSPTFTYATFNPIWVDYDISEAGIVLNGPFFVGVEFASGSTGSIPSTLTDDVDNIDTGLCYIQSGGIWTEHYDYWNGPEGVGHGMIRALVETTPGQLVSLQQNMHPERAINRTQGGGTAISLDLPENIETAHSRVNRQQSGQRDTRELLGYNIYRDFDANGEFGLVNASPIEHTFYLDTTPDFTGDYCYYVTAVYDAGESDPSNDEHDVCEFVEVIPPAIEGGEIDEIPTVYSLSRNYPNPFNPRTTIQFALPEAGQVKMTIYNSTGQVVKTLVDAEMEAAYHSVQWDGTNDSGQTISSGVYFYKMEAGEFTQTQRMMLLK